MLSPEPEAPPLVVLLSLPTSTYASRPLRHSVSMVDLVGWQPYTTAFTYLGKHLTIQFMLHAGTAGEAEHLQPIKPMDQQASGSASPLRFTHHTFSCPSLPRVSVQLSPISRGE